MVLGVRFLVRGIGFVARRPRLWLLGLLPALVTFAGLVALLTLLGVFVADIAAWATPFADGWSDWARDLTRVVLAVAVMVGAAFVALLLFVSLTLLVGQPFYERISRAVDAEFGDAPVEPEEPWHAAVRRAIVETLATLARTVPAAVLVFAVGLIPAVGQIAGPVLAALIGGRFLTLELLAPAMERRGRYLPERRAFARRHRGEVYGFGVPAFVAFIVPLLAVVLMPGAVAGATMLVREMGDMRAAATDR
ncbi:MAG: EI24 domain-containing protein [Streptosporangiales bacterium]